MNIKLVAPQKFIIDGLKYMVKDRSFDCFSEKYVYELEKMFKRGDYCCIPEDRLFELERQGKVEFVNP